MKLIDSIRNFFTKQSKINRLLVAYGSGQPVWSDIKYDKLADEGYAKNAYVYRCINLVSMACGGIPWLLYRKRGKNKRELDDHPLIRLMEQPNPQQGDTKFVENVIAYLLLSGNSYIERVGPRNGAPKELYTLRPDRMMVIKGNARQPVAGYEYRVDGQPFQFSAESILHLKTFHPLDDWYGLPPLSAAARATDQSNESKAWNVAMLQNSARPSGILSTEDALSDDQFHKLKQQLAEKYQGRRNAGRPMLLEGGLSWQQISLNAKDMEWLEGQKIAAREIAMVFGVPSELLGDSTNKTYSNYREARQAFYMETVLPLMDWLRDELNNWLTPLFGDNLFLDYDTDAIEAIQEDRTQVWKRSSDAVRFGLLTINEAREAMGYDSHPDGDILMAPSSMKPLGQEEEAEEEEASPKEPPPDEPQSNHEDDQEPTDDPKKIKWQAFSLETEEKKAIYWKAIDRLRDGWERSVKNQVSGQFEQERRDVVAAAKQANDIYNIEFQAIKQIDARLWNQLFTAIYLGVMEDFGERTAEGFKADYRSETKQEDFSDLFWTQETLTFVETVVAEKVTQITDTTKQQIKEIVAIGIQEGESIDQIAARIDDLYLDDIISNRSEVIARTETISASNAGSQYGAKSTGLPLRKTWLSTDDSRTRPSHKRIDGETRDLDERYSNGLMFPGDPTGSSRETIQCRCTQFYAVKGGD